MGSKEIQAHITGTYRNLRRGLTFMGFAFPLVLWIVGFLWFGVPFQRSMSDYYFAESAGTGIVPSLLKQVDLWPIKQLLFFLDQFDPHTPMRSWFVGLLFVLGVLMILYSGFSRLENWLLNAAGVLAVGVALFPTGCDNCPPITLHGTCAISAFVLLVLVAVFCAKQTLTIGLAPARATFYRHLYNVTATLMLVFPLAAVIVTWVWGLFGQSTHFVFFAELLGLWCFALYWYNKSRELAENRAEIHAVEGRLMSTHALMRTMPSLGLKQLELAPD